MKALDERITDILNENISEQTMTFGQDDYQIISQIHDMAEILDKKYDGNEITLRFRLNKRYADKLKKVLARKTIR